MLWKEKINQNTKKLQVFHALPFKIKSLKRDKSLPGWVSAVKYTMNRKEICNTYLKCNSN